MTGLKPVIQTAFTDTSLPKFFPGVGVAGFSHRYVMGALEGSSGASVTSVPSAGGTAKTPLIKANSSDASPVIGLDGAMRYVSFSATASDLRPEAAFAARGIKTVIVVIRPKGAVDGTFFNGGGVLMQSNVYGYGAYLDGNTAAPFYDGTFADKWSAVMLTIPDVPDGATMNVNGVDSAKKGAGANSGANVSIAQFGGKKTYDIAEIVMFPFLLTAAQRTTVYKALKGSYPVLP